MTTGVARDRAGELGVVKRTQTASFTHGIAVLNEAHFRDGRRMNALSITAEQTEE